MIFTGMDWSHYCNRSSSYNFIDPTESYASEKSTISTSARKKLHIRFWCFDGSMYKKFYFFLPRCVVVLLIVFL